MYEMDIDQGKHSLLNGRSGWLPKKQTVKQLALFSIGSVFVMLSVNLTYSDKQLNDQGFFQELLPRNRSFLPNSDWQPQNISSTGNVSERVHPGELMRKLISSTEITTTRLSNHSAQTFTKIIVNNKNNGKTTTKSTVQFNYRGPFSINASNSTVDVRLLQLPKNMDNLCNREKKLIVNVISTPLEFAQRNAIRQTWATEAGNDISVIFHIGALKSSNEALLNNITEQLEDEQVTYGDILLSNVVEDYYNLTLKTYAMLLFTSQYCPHSKCVLKCDSDAVVNLPAIERLCHETSAESSTIVGNCNSNSPDRNPFSKWFTPVWVWPTNYPKFCLGSAYMLIGTTISKQLLHNANRTAFFNSGNFRKMGEDVIWTGIVAEEAKIIRTWTLGFSPQNNLIYHCFKDGQKSAFTVHYIRGIYNVMKYWRIMQTPRKCF